MRNGVVPKQPPRAPVATTLVAAGAAHANVAPEDSIPGAQDRWLLPAIAIGTTLAPLNSTMIAVALPEIQNAFGVSITATSWLVTIYLVAMAAGQPIGGRLGDIYGRRRIYLAGLIWFGIASAGCAFAPDLGWLIVFRTMQALAGALSFPNGAAMVREAVPQERRGAAFGLIGMATGIAAASGPPLGGLLVNGFGWSAIFWANIPVIAVALLLGWRSLPKRRIERTTRARFDLAGTALLASSMTVVILIPTLLKFGSPLLAIGAGCLGIAIAWTFVRWELRAQAPVVNVRLFASPRFAAACAAVGLGNLVMYTTLLALPLYLEVVLHRSVQASGFVLVALSALSAICGPVGGRWSDRSGRWMPAVFGGAAMLAGMLVITTGVGWASVAAIVAGLAVMGIGLGVSGAPIQTAAVESVPIETAGAAAGIFSTSRYLGSVLGSSILAALFAQHSDDLSNDRFLVLFAGLSVAAIGGIVANSRIASREVRGLSIEGAR